MSTPGRSSLALILGAATLAAGACRDDVTPPNTEDAAFPASIGRLTSSDGDDRTPSWSSAGDSIYYSAEGFGHLPPAPGVLVGLPRDGGPAREILKNVQLANDAGIFAWFVAPQLSPLGDQVAFVEIAPLTNLSLFCDTIVSVTVCSPELESPRLPPLRQIYLRVRRFDATGALADDPVLEVPIPGLIEQEIENPSPFDPPVVHIIHNYPFQQLFDRERAFLFRPNWAPDGERLVFSDGLRILVWEIGAAAAKEIPGTDDGMEPAWSPDGEWIAFSRYERVDSTNAACQFIAVMGPCEGHERTDYLPGRRLLTLIRPDGSGVRVLGEGDEPAWAPDGRTIFFRNADLIWSVPRSGGQPARVPGTGGGREPAVSPDGRLLAFAKLGGDGDYDIWVAELRR